MNKKNYLIIFTVISIMFFISSCTSQPSSISKSQSIQNTSLINNTSQNIDSSLITSLDLAKHNSENDCWVVYDKKVYDITIFLPLHPGGKEKLIPLCGTSDKFQNAFTKKHGLSKVEILIAKTVYKGDFLN